jgi:hypothetical protein
MMYGHELETELTQYIKGLPLEPQLSDTGEDNNLRSWA